MNAIPQLEPVGSPEQQWKRFPVELRERSQWVIVAPHEKRPRTITGGAASSMEPGTWSSFARASTAAADRGWQIGYVLSEDDPFACIDLDVKETTTTEQRERHQRIIEAMDSYTERSRGGEGTHIWVRASVGQGCKRDGVELYSRARFIICTGNVVRDLPVTDRQDLISNMLAQMRPTELLDAELRNDTEWDDLGCCVAALAIEDPGEMGGLMRGEWHGLDDAGVRKYPSQSEADFALLLMLGRLTDSNRACREAFRLSLLGRREKARQDDRYLNRTLRKVRAVLYEEALKVAHGCQVLSDLLWPKPNPLDALRVDWDTEADADAPDIVEGLVADEEVTLLGGHGGAGKGFLALQFAAAVATGTSILNHPARQARVLYYSAEDGRKRLTRRLRTLADEFNVDRSVLRTNLMVVDASELEPLYGESIEQTDGKRPSFVKMLGARADFNNLQKAVEAFDPQLVVVDGASDTFDGNEIARREVRAFIKLLRRVHPTRKVGVLLIVHIDRSSARGNVTNDDGYAGSAQWHNSCRRRLFLQQEVKREKDEMTDEWVAVPGNIKLRVMKNQDGPPDPDAILSRTLSGFWQAGATDIDALSGQERVDHSPTLLRLIASYYERGTYISVSLAPNATTGVYASLKDDPQFPRGLTKKATFKLVRQLQHGGFLVPELYKRNNRGTAERWAVLPCA